jgi:hypothetical protein
MPRSFATEVKLGLTGQADQSDLIADAASADREAV